jgi:hypothetical protein
MCCGLDKQGATGTGLIGQNQVDPPVAAQEVLRARIAQNLDQPFAHGLHIAGNAGMEDHEFHRGSMPPPKLVRGYNNAEKLGFLCIACTQREDRMIAGNAKGPEIRLAEAVCGDCPGAVRKAGCGRNTAESKACNSGRRPGSTQPMNFAGRLGRRIARCPVERGERRISIRNLQR